MSDDKPLETPVEVPADADAPVYDERGNVRPRGTEGARPMTYDERVEIARRLGAGEVVESADTPTPDPVEEPTPRSGRATKKPAPEPEKKGEDQ